MGSDKRCSAMKEVLRRGPGNEGVEKRIRDLLQRLDGLCGPGGRVELDALEEMRREVDAIAAAFSDSKGRGEATQDDPDEQQEKEAPR
eukprot:scaffold140_cov247-Pinguiococcus_pyrenoidosus.AAC.3